MSVSVEARVIWMVTLWWQTLVWGCGDCGRRRMGSGGRLRVAVETECVDGGEWICAMQMLRLESTILLSPVLCFNVVAVLARRWLWHQHASVCFGACDSAPSEWLAGRWCVAKKPATIQQVSSCRACVFVRTGSVCVALAAGWRSAASERSGTGIVRAAHSWVAARSRLRRDESALRGRARSGPAQPHASHDNEHAHRSGSGSMWRRRAIGK